MTHLNIPKDEHGNRTGFELDCAAICKVSTKLKELVALDLVYEDPELAVIMQEVKDFVSMFFPKDPHPSASDVEDRPQFDLHTQPNRAERRANRKETFKLGEGWSSGV